MRAKQHGHSRYPKVGVHYASARAGSWPRASGRPAWGLRTLPSPVRHKLQAPTLRKTPSGVVSLTFPFTESEPDVVSLTFPFTESEADVVGLTFPFTESEPDVVGLTFPFTESEPDVVGLTFPFTGSAPDVVSLTFPITEIASGDGGWMLGRSQNPSRHVGGSLALGRLAGDAAHRHPGRPRPGPEDNGASLARPGSGLRAHGGSRSRVSLKSSHHWW